jgi:rod shape-determining protein MreD
MDYLLLLAALYLFSAAQLALGPAVAIDGTAPNLLAAAAGVWMLVDRDERSLIAAAMWGLAADLVGGGRLGPALGAYLAVACCLLWARPAAPLPGWLTILASMLAVIAATLLETLIRVALGEQAFAGDLFQTWFSTGLYSAAIAGGIAFLVRSAVAIFGTDEPASAWKYE